MAIVLRGSARSDKQMKELIKEAIRELRVEDSLANFDLLHDKWLARLGEYPYGNRK